MRKTNLIKIDFLGLNKNIKEKTLGLYFKCMFINNYNLTPTEAKIQFKKKFPN